MSEEITLQELLPNEFYLDKEGNIVAEISLKQINQIGDILVNYHKENERLNNQVKDLEVLVELLYNNVALNQEQEKLLDHILFGSDKE